MTFTTRSQPTIFENYDFHNQTTFENYDFHNQITTNHSLCIKLTKYEAIYTTKEYHTTRSQLTILDNKLTKYDAIYTTKEHHTTRSKTTISDNRRNITTYTLDRFTKTFFWNFQKSRADLCCILIYKQMLEKVFCSNIAPSSSSRNYLFYKAEYMGQSCLN